MNHHLAMTTIDSIKKSLVALRMPRALEVLDATFRRIDALLPQRKVATSVRTSTDLRSETVERAAV